MGLDIRAYSEVTMEREESDDTTYLSVGGEFYGQHDNIVEGPYAFAESISFSVGSYHGYNHWREQLCKAVHGVGPEVIWDAPDEWRGKPFVELINFSDCEGTIGTNTSAKLADDFRNHEPVYTGDDQTWFWDAYRDFQKAFELAAKNGAVSFR